MVDIQLSWLKTTAVYIENVMNNDPLIRDFVTLNKSVINYLTKVFISLTLTIYLQIGKSTMARRS